MAETAPSPPSFKLPQDVTTLAQMRDQLSDYLNALERNTDAINLWLQKNQPQLIMGHHQLVRAIKYNKNEQEALQVLAAFGDAAGFVLSVGDFGALAEASFGKNSQLGQAIAKSQLGVPPKILEDLPEIKLPDPNAAPPLAPAPKTAAPPPAPEPEPEKKKWWQPSGWFSKGDNAGSSKGDAPSPEEIEAENKRREDALRRHWRLVRDELVSLQSERHYYVDSFMDWVGENIAPENNQAKPGVEKLLDQYQNPQYVIDLARADYAEVIDVKAQAVREKSLLYSKTATLIDEQKIAEFAALLPGLFPTPATNETKQMREFLLQDFGAASFADLALTKVQSRADQLLLLKTALAVEPDFKLAGLTSRRDIFERILKETTAPDDPLDSSALKLALDKLKTGKDDDLADLIGLKSGAPKNVFARVVERFRSDLKAVGKALGQLIGGLEPAAGAPEQRLTGFLDAADRKDGAAMGRVLDAVASEKTGQKFMALWELTGAPDKLTGAPGAGSLAGQLIGAARDKAELAALTEKALSAGILDELKINTNAASGSAANFFRFFEQQVLSEPGAFSLTTARRLLAANFANGGLDQLRLKLNQPGGWLEQIAASKLPQEGKLNWISGLLEPFSSDITKANILFEASSARGAQPAAAALLGQLEANFASENVRFGDGRVMANLGRIANIWYNAEIKSMRYTVSGTGHTFLEGISPAAAKEVLSLLQRKGGFTAEYDGIFKPENIDRITTTPPDATTPVNTKITWNRSVGQLNVDQAALDVLHKRDDFLHVKGADGTLLSVNQKSIALLQPLSDGTHLLVDRYGAVQILDGEITLKAADPLLDLSGTWFNPRNASVLQLTAAKNRLEFRCESDDFQDLLENAAPDQYFYPVDLASAADFAKVSQAVKDSPQIVSPAGMPQFQFNLEQLGYMMFVDDARETGFKCRKNGKTRRPGLISADADLAKNIFDGLASSPDVLAVGNVITHKDSIDDAYYNAEKQHFYFLTGTDILQIPCPEAKDEAAAYKTLKKLAREDGFTVVGASYVGNTEMPADIVNMNRATMMFYSAATDKTWVIAENDRFQLSLDEGQARDLFDLVEKEGLAGAKAATVKAAWTQNLKDTLETLPVQQVKIPPALTETGGPYLLQQVLGPQGETRPMPKPQEDFSIASAPVKANDNFTYPPRNKATRFAPGK